MRMIKFGNDGLIDERLWATFGISIKANEDSIGKFGTGLKYAIAVMMREKRQLKIVSGGKEYIFSVSSVSIKGKEFQQITCNDECLPFTTHLGSHWELWQAYRELYSNCLDEGGDLDYEGETIIYAELGDIKHSDVFFDYKKYRIAENGPNCDIYHGGSKWVYYKGIRVFESRRPMKYTYNLKSAYLTEDRTLRYPHEIQEFAAEAVLGGKNSDFIVEFLTQTKGFEEESFSFSYGNPPISDMAIKCVESFRRNDCYKQEELVKKVLSVIGPLQYDFIDADSRQEKIIDVARKFCGTIGFPVLYPIRVAKNLDQRTLALANRKTKEIYLSENLLTMGIKQVASVLIEENLHLEKGFDDCTYEMQTYLFNQIVTMGEKLIGEVI